MHGKLHAKTTARIMGRPKLRKPKQPQPIAMTIRAPKAWLEWIDQLRARHNNVPRTILVDIALAQLAERSGVEAAPPRY